MAERRLRDGKFRGGLREAAVSSYRQEGREVIQIAAGIYRICS
jgi:hypothetical protein